MRKNLFLTLAFSLAAFAGVNAQNWSATLSSGEGLPGRVVDKEGTEVRYVKTGLIRTDKPIEVLRYTVNKTGRDNSKFFAISELTVYAKDGKTVIPYNPISNADHNYLAHATDGAGLTALNDGRIDNFFHSMYNGEPAIDGDHYIELIFEEPVDAFILEWTGRSGHNDLAPTIVGLTEGGVEFVPNTDTSFEHMADKQLTTIEAIKNVKYLTIRGNAPEKYNQYYNSGTNMGQIVVEDGVKKENLEGSGPMFVTHGNVAAEEPNIDHVARLIPVEDEENVFYLYYPLVKKYLSSLAGDNSYDVTVKNGWVGYTSNIDDAAKITLTPVGDGDFEMTFTMICEEVDELVYIGQTPIQGNGGKMKTFSKDRKVSLEENGYAAFYAVKCAFNWSFFEAGYQAPAWKRDYELGSTYVNALLLQEGAGTTPVIEGVIATLEEALANSASKSEDEINEIITETNNTLKDGYLTQKITEAYMEAFAVIDPTYSVMKSPTPVEDQCSEAAYQEYIFTNIVKKISDLAALLEDPEEDILDHMNEIVSYFSNKQKNIDKFLASKYVFSKELPSVITNKEGALGNLDSIRYVWEQTVELPEPVSGFRLTFLDHVKGNANVKLYKGYPIITLSGLEVIKADYETRVALEKELLSSNSVDLSEATTENAEQGRLASLLDNDVTTFWHSIWGGDAEKNGVMEPEGYVYLDVAFPDGEMLSKFTIKTIGRATPSGGIYAPQFSPKTVAITNYGETYVKPEEGEDEGEGEDNVEDGEYVNKYHVAIGEQVTDPAQLIDGGLYVLQGNLRANKDEEPSKPRYYAGNVPFTAEAADANNDACVYMFKKAGEGWNIISLANAQYISSKIQGTDVGLTRYADEFANIKITKSENMNNAMLLYSEITDTLLYAAWTGKGINAAGDSIEMKIDSTEVTANRLIYMDWDGNMSARPVVDIQPGKFTVGYDVIGADTVLIHDSQAGDRLHFTKTNGEAEWNIYNVKMDDPYFVWLSAIVEQLDDLSELGLTPGKNPGDIKLEEETAEIFETAKAEAVVAVKGNKRDNAEALVKQLTDAIDLMNKSDRVGFEEGVDYLIVSALQDFTKTSPNYRAIHESDDKLSWCAAPRYFVGYNEQYLFQVEDAETAGKDIEENEVGKAYLLKNVESGRYAAADESGNAVNTMSSDLQATVFVFDHIGNGEYNILTTKNHKMVHAAGHLEGKGFAGNIVFYNGGRNTASSWKFILMDEENKSSVSDVVVEGDEVVEEYYYTASGIALPAPVKGINIIVKKYANGVVEAQKVLVK